MSSVYFLGIAVVAVALWLQRRRLRELQLQLRAVQDELEQAKGAFFYLRKDVHALGQASAELQAQLLATSLRALAAPVAEAAPPLDAAPSEPPTPEALGAAEQASAAGWPEPAPIAAARAETPHLHEGGAVEEAAARIADGPDDATKAELRRRLMALSQQPAQGEPQAPPAEPSPPPPASPSEFDWEQWIGVRGAAALGAAVLVIAGAYFFKYSVEHELISPPMRIVLGATVGLGASVGAELWLWRRHETLASCLSGAGFAILNLCAWAGFARYHLFSSGVAGLAMVAVTATCCAIADRRRSRAVALFGLVGGFSTPLLLSTGSDRPIALFSYLLLLDAALLFIAYRRRWPLLALLSLLGTCGYQGLWILGRMQAEGLWIGIAVVAVFALVFALAPRPPPVTGGVDGQPVADRSVAHWTRMQIVALLVPFLFTLYFGLRVELTPRLYPTGLLLTLLVSAASWVGRRDGTAWLGSGAACAALGVLSAWSFTHDVVGAAWEVVGVAAGLALVLAGLTELESRRARRRGHPSPVDDASVFWSGGALLVTAVAVAFGASPLPWPWLGLWTLLAGVGLRHAARPGRRGVAIGAAAALGCSWLALVLPHLGSAGFPSAEVMVALGLASAAAFHLVAFLFAPAETRRAVVHGAALLSLFMLVVVTRATRLDALTYVAATLVVEVLVCFAVTRARAAGWWLLAMPAIAVAQWWRAAWPMSVSAADQLVVHAGQLLAVALLTSWIFTLDAATRNTRWPYRIAALTPAVFFPAALHVHEMRFGDGAIGVVPLGFALMSLSAAAVALRLRRAEDPAVQRSALAWLCGATLAFVTAAAPLQLRNEWITIAWALQGAALLALWRRLDHAGLKYVALALFVAVTARLVLNPYALAYHARGAYRIVNWLSYTYLIPCASMLAGGYLLRHLETARRRPWERSLGERPIVATASLLCALGVFFVWLNLTILDWYSSERYLSVTFERLPARDLTFSIAWILLGLALLAVGMWRVSVGLRRLSLSLVALTCGKVFLYDLSHLSDLYRVVSLIGLSVSLILVSIAYRLVVFRPAPAAERAGGAE